jgi:hydroxymethylpyrimidine/phosphomethylpyrimidine kinase
MQATVLSIAGSDPTGGAGIQADLKTMTSIGVFGAAAVTCVTVQNSHGVVRIECLPPDLVYQQIQAVLADYSTTHVKIGMVGNLSIAEAICESLSCFAGEIIYDPVMLSSSGQSLMEECLPEAPAHLVRQCTVLTPNIPELARLSGTEIKNHQDALRQAEQLFAQYKRLRAILVKGGHMIQDGTVIDTLLWRTDEGFRTISVSHELIRTSNTHGTGCTLASAFASFHCLTGDYSRSFRQSIDYMHTVLKNSASKKVVRNPDGPGSLLHYSYKPENGKS